MEASALRAPAGLSQRPARRLLRLRSDDQLVALFRLGNDEAFRVIHDRYRQRLFSYTRQMLSGSRADAEDALQDVFLRAYHALRADDRPVTLRAWLYRVAHNRCIDHLRRGAAGGFNVVELFDTIRSLHDPMEEAQRREDLARLVADVRRLPEQQRSALLMREMEGLTYQELADALEVTVPAVKSLLVRARMGLVEAQTARDTSCSDIRTDLALAHDRGVRANGRARRHMRECAGCRGYRATLKGVASGLSALQPAGPGGWALVAKLFGIGGAGSGAAAGGTAAAGGGAAATGTIAVGGGAAAVTATKVAAVVCCAALVGGGAVEVEHVTSTGRSKPARAARSAAAVKPGPISSSSVMDRPSAARPVVAPPAHHRRAATRHVATPVAATPSAGGTRHYGLAGPIASDEERLAADKAGGLMAPEEPVDAAPGTTPPPTQPATGPTSSLPILGGSGGGSNAGAGGGGPSGSGTGSSGGAGNGSSPSADAKGPGGANSGGAAAPMAQGASASPSPDD